MLQIGKFNELPIKAISNKEITLQTEEGEVKLPRHNGPVGLEVGDKLSVFIYQDSKGELMATTTKPIAEVGEFGYMRVVDVNRYGAFLDWGLDKDLFVPYGEQRMTMEKGKKYMVRVYLDKIKKRITATTKVEKHLSNDRVPYYEGEQVEMMVYEFTDLGAKVIIDNKYQGLLFRSEMFQDVEIGDKVTGYIQKIREDNKMDVTLRQMGRQGTESAKDRIIEALRANKNFLPVNDNSSPETIKELLQMSKNAFKKALGGLYKERLVELTEDGVILKEDE